MTSSKDVWFSDDFDSMETVFNYLFEIRLILQLKFGEI